MIHRYGIIGTGMMGQEHIRNIKLLEGASVHAIADPDPGMRKTGSRLAGPDCLSFETDCEMMNRADLHAIVVAAPNHLHYPILQKLLHTDIAILCEKPLGISESQCIEIERWQSLRRAPFWVAMEYRYMAAVERLLEEIDKGTAGTPRMLTIREHRYPFLRKVGDWNRFNALTGGTLVEKCCHFFDLMRLILKSEPVRILASGGMDVNFLDETYDQGKPDILDNAYVVVEFASRARAMLDLCMFAEGAHWQEEISLVGDRARIDARIPAPARFDPDGRDRPSELLVHPRDTRRTTVEEISGDPTIQAAGDHHGATFFQHRKFLQMLQTGSDPAVSVRDGRLAVAMGAAAEQSIRTGQPVAVSHGGDCDLPDQDPT